MILQPPPPPVATPVAEAAHHIAAPSSRARHIQCPQSISLEAQFPEDGETEEQREGTAAHWAVSEMLSGRLVDTGQIAPNGYVLTHEMVLGADLMYDDVVKQLAPFGLKPHQGQIEQRVRIERVFPGLFGSPDFYILIARPNARPLLMLWDYKFGHRFVEVFENAQMVDYVAGITDGIHDTMPGVDIVVTIVQPRSYSSEGPVRRWKTELVKLRALINVSSNAVHEGMQPNARAKVGEECRDCRARHACPTLQRAGFAGMDEAKRVTPEVMTPANAALELRLLQRSIALMKARASGLEQQIENDLRSGKPVPGWMLEPGEAREKWKVPAAQVIETGKLLRLDLAKPQEAITPRQARDKGFDPAIAALLAERGPAGMRLVEDDGTRARKIFG